MKNKAWKWFCTLWLNGISVSGTLTSVNRGLSSAWFGWKQMSVSEQLVVVEFPAVTQSSTGWRASNNLYNATLHKAVHVRVANRDKRIKMLKYCHKCHKFYPETKMEHGVLLVDTLPCSDHLRKEGFDYIQVSWFQDVVLWPGTEHLEGPSESSAHLLLAEKLYFCTEAPLSPGRHAVVDRVRGALLQTVNGHRLPWRNTEQQVMITPHTVTTLK